MDWEVRISQHLPDCAEVVKLAAYSVVRLQLSSGPREGGRRMKGLLSLGKTLFCAAQAGLRTRCR